MARDTQPGSGPATDGDFYVETGRALRALRTQRGLSLAALAAESGLSQSFLSQMERGLVRASFASLSRVTRALGTTTQAIMVMRASDRVVVVRAGEGRAYDDSRLLVPGLRSIRVMEMTGAQDELGEVYEHVEEEVIYVADGIVEVETDGRDRILLGSGESVFLAAGVPHRWRRVGGGPLRVIIVAQGTNPQPTA